MARRVAVASWLPAAAWGAVIFAFSSQPNLRFVADDVIDLVVRKIGHMGVFGILAALVWFALGRARLPRRWVWALAVTVLYAITDELHQGFVAGRHPSPVDVGIDAAGALIALAVVLVAGRSRRVSR